MGHVWQMDVGADRRISGNVVVGPWDPASPRTRLLAPSSVVAFAASGEGSVLPHGVGSINASNGVFTLWIPPAPAESTVSGALERNLPLELCAAEGRLTRAYNDGDAQHIAREERSYSAVHERACARVFRIMKRAPRLSSPGAATSWRARTRSGGRRGRSRRRSIQRKAGGRGSGDSGDSSGGDPDPPRQPLAFLLAPGGRHAQ